MNRCPLIVKGPGVPKGKSCDAFTHVHDLYATICDFAKVELPRGVDSKSLTRLMRGEIEHVHESMFLPFQDNQRSISDGSWKLHIYPKIDHRLLFNLEVDSHERKNLATDRAHDAQLKRMLALMNLE